MIKRDYYEILGVDKNSTQEEVKKKYRTLAMIHHPDKGGDAELFKEITEAYEVLSDKDKRRNYDLHGHQEPTGRGGYDPMEEFLRRAGMGRFTRQHQAKGSDMSLVVNLTLEEIYTGVVKKFKYQRNDGCKTCNNKGGTGIKKCTKCDGSGIIVETVRTPFGQVQNGYTCDACSGDGNIYETMCNDCNGSGVKLIEDLLDLTIPSGVVNGMKMVMEGRGHAAKSAVNGNLFITIVELSHSKFNRINDDLKTKVKVTYPQLILGDKIEVDTIEGGKIKVLVPEFTNVGKTLRVSNKGLKNLNTNLRGDMLIEIDLTIPKEISDEEKELIIKLKKINDKVAP